MSGSTHVFIVSSPRPRAGKTLVARLITEFHHASARPVAAFDLEPFEPGLVQFLPALATRVSLSDTRGEMALFDRLVLDDGHVKVVDLSHLVLEKFFTVAFDIGFAAEAQRRGISAVVMYVADQTAIALGTYRILREKLPTLAFAPIYNDGIARGPDLRRQFTASAGSVAPLHIPQLSSPLRAVIDRPPFSFEETRRRPPMQLAPNLRDELESFVKRVFRELREAELALLMNNLKVTLAEQIIKPSGA